MHRRLQLCVLLLLLQMVYYFIGSKTGSGHEVKGHRPPASGEAPVEERYEVEVSLCKTCRKNDTCLSWYGEVAALRQGCGGSRSLADKLRKLRKTLEATPDPPAPEIDKHLLLYQVIVLLLLVSVTTSLVECFRERCKKKSLNSDGGGGGDGAGPEGRRMSLADLTMSRHQRRQSQAYRPSGKLRFLKTAADPQLPKRVGREVQGGRRSSLSGQQQEEGGEGSRKVTRQISCPQPRTRRLSSFEDEDSGWAERRRVRMIHRH